MSRESIFNLVNNNSQAQHSEQPEDKPTAVAAPVIVTHDADNPTIEEKPAEAKHTLSPR